MKKLNKQSKIIIQVTKIGGQYCSNIIEEFNDDILTENECELKTMVRGMIAKMQKQHGKATEILKIHLSLLSPYGGGCMVKFQLEAPMDHLLTR